MVGKKSSWLNAIWQFLIDHSRVENNGLLYIGIHVKDKRDFENRVLARKKYGYLNNDVEYTYKKQRELFRRILESYYRKEEKTKRYERVVKRIKKQGSLKDKVVLFLYRKTKKILFDDCAKVEIKWKQNLKNRIKASHKETKRVESCPAIQEIQQADQKGKL